jgi:hypothetical protein
MFIQKSARIFRPASEDVFSISRQGPKASSMAGSGRPTASIDIWDPQSTWRVTNVDDMDKKPSFNSRWNFRIGKFERKLIFQMPFLDFHVKFQR